MLHRAAMFPCRHRCTLRVVLAPALAAGMSLAQQPDFTPPKPAEPQELREVRRQFTARALGLSRLLADQYTNALATLEAQAADAGDYETALGAQRRRRELDALYATLAATPSEAYVLRPADAKTVGAVTLDRNEGTLVNWRTTGSSAIWDINRLTPGTYTVSITCSVAESAAASPAPVIAGTPSENPTAGEVEFSELTALSIGEPPKLSAALKSTGGWTEYATVTLGEFKFTRTSARVVLKASRLRGAGGLMRLKEVRLTPGKADLAPPDPSVAEQLATARDEHNARLRTLEAPLVADYLEKLRAIRAGLKEKEDADGLQQVTAELDRVQRLIETGGGTVRTWAHVSHTGEGFEEIRGATYVDSPTNTADRFLVAANDEQFSVRLLYVTCPPPQPEDRKAHEKTSAGFGISLEDSVAVGRQAQDFVAAFLKDRKLKVLRRGQKDQAGSVAAIVLLEDAGDLAGILVDNGLAIVNEPAAQSAAQRRAEDGALSALKQREAAARARPVPPGAWLFADTPPAAK